MKKMLLPLVALMLSMVACQKDNEGILTLKIEKYASDAKVHLNDDKYAVWDDGDEIWLNGAQKTVTINGTTATISVGVADAYTAIYPYEWAGNNTITYPAEQTYRANGIDAPMAAYCGASDNSLSFRNLGSLLAVNVSGVSKVMKIEVVADGNTLINGTASINFSGERPTLGNLSSGTNTTTLNCNGTTIAENETKTFYIALPPVTAKLTIKVYDDYYCYERTQVSAKQYQANYGYNVPFDASEISSPEQYAPLSTQIWYTATSQISFWRLINILGDPIDHTFSDGRGVITFSGDITDIPYQAFFDNRDLTSITLPANVETIGEEAFFMCTSLTSIDMPNVTYIEEKAFKDCYSLSSVNMPQVTSIRENAFYRCDHIISIDMPNVITIGISAFQECDQLTSINMPNVTTIKEKAFEECTGLSSVNMPKVTSIGVHAFLECRSLSEVHVYSVLNNVEMGAFEQCSITDLYVHSSNPPSIAASSIIYTSSVTVHVPQSSTYDWTSWWSGTVVHDL